MTGPTHHTPRLLAFAVAALVALTGTPASAQECATTSLENGCKFRCAGDFTPMPPVSTGPQPTDFGEWICTAIDQIAAAGAELGESATSYVTSSQDDLAALVNLAFRDAVNRESVRTFNKALDVTGTIEERIVDLVADSECGVNAGLGELEQFFDDRVAGIETLVSIWGQLAGAIQATYPAADSLASAIAQVQQLATTLQDPTSATQAALSGLESALAAMQAELQAIAALEGYDAAFAGIDMGVTVGPFLFKCGKCVFGISSTVASMSTTLAAAPDAVACPETWPAAGGSCWGTTKAVPGVIGAGVAHVLIANPTCLEAAAKAGDVGKYLDKIHKFVTTSATLADRLVEAGGIMANDIHPALNALAQALGSDAEPHLTAIEASVNGAAAEINEAISILNTEVIPAATGWGANALYQISTGVVRMTHCYNKVHGVGQAIAGDVLEGVEELLLAAAHLVHGTQIAMNIVDAGTVAATAAGTYAMEEFNRLTAERNRIHMALWGVPWPSLPPSSALLDLVAEVILNPVDVTTLLLDIAALEAAHATLVVDAIQEGKNALLNIDADQDNARAEFDLAGPIAAGALSKIDNPGTLAVGPMDPPGVGSWQQVKLDPGLAPGGVPPVGFLALNYAEPLHEAIRAMESLRYVVLDPTGSPVNPGSPCTGCRSEWQMRDFWDVLDRAAIRQEVLIKVLRDRTLYADLGRHAPPRDGRWAAHPTVHEFLTPDGWRFEASGCGFQVEVTSTRGEPLARGELCVQGGP